MRSMPSMQPILVNAINAIHDTHATNNNIANQRESCHQRNQYYSMPSMQSMLFNSINAVTQSIVRRLGGGS
eukprot:3306015-Lingulodinium_polyedra.AAC.1